MEINGTLSPSTKIFLEVVRLGGQRVRIPAAFAKRVGLTVTSSISCWLIVMADGRFRLVKQTERPKEGYLGRFFDYLDELSEGEEYDGTESNEYVAISARLIPCVVKPPKSGPRLNIPKEALELVAGDRSRVFLRVVEGALELWFPDALKQAISKPISEVLP
jgi:hypothetical protein